MLSEGVSNRNLLIMSTGSSYWRDPARVHGNSGQKTNSMCVKHVWVVSLGGLQR